MAACSERQSKYPYKWQLIGEPFDSLMDRLEWQFNDFAPFDSIEKTIFQLENSVKEISKERETVAQSRVLYWQARYLQRRQIIDSALFTLKKALSLNDSIKFRYDRLRMFSLWYTSNDSTDGAAQYRHFEEAMDYASSVGDIPYQGHTAINMGNLLNAIGENKKALHYLSLADSLYSIAGFTKIVVKNGINVARVLSDAGERERGDSILKTLLNNPILEDDTIAINTVSRNLWASTHEKPYLLTAYNQIKDSPNYRHLRGFYRGLLALQNYWEENYDSTLYYSDLALADLPFVTDYNHKAIIWFNIGLANMIKNQPDSALICRIRYENYIDSVQIGRHATEVLRLSALHEMGIKEAEYTASIYRRNMILVIVGIVLVATSIITWLLINRRNMRHRIEAMKNELELEKAKRKIAATTLSIEEKDNMLTAIRSELSEMRQEGEIKEGSARKLESTIKSHLLESENEETFREMFDVVNPKFTERLRERCPELADSYIKLACYMLMELDNKRIASLMMIKPESVRQARWRLSQRLKLPENETLESFLRSLNNDF
ncbi:MAG: hypothetical protein HDR88_16555 [Bacteroides sp.]|nr:hypothetical protein [Bacteroides sp.]